MNGDRFVDVLGSPVRYRVEGSGPPVILIHGIGASLEFWNWTVPALRDRFTTIALDLPGFGQSAADPGTYSPKGTAEMVLAFMDAVGLRTATLIGSSLGGAIATLAAGTAPERVTALVLVAPGGFGRGLNLIMRLETLPGLGEALLPLVRLNPRLAVRDVFADRRRIPPALLEIIRQNAARVETGRTFLDVLRKAATLRGVRPEMVAQIHAAAAHITAPTLIVWGDRDRITPSNQAAVAGRVIPNARVHMMRGIGHLPLIEAATAFNTAVTAFMFETVRPVQTGAAR